MQWKVSRSASRLAQELGREPSGEEIGADIGCTADDVSEAVQALGCFQPSSLDRPVAGAHDTTLGDVIADQQEHIYDAVDARAILGPVFRCLPERDRRVLYLRFFEERSQKEIGAELGVTQTQVSRLLDPDPARPAPAAPRRRNTGLIAGCRGSGMPRLPLALGLTCLG